MLNRNKDFFVFGGYVAARSNVIARFNVDSRRWDQVGSLKSGRYAHSVIDLGQSFLVVGGSSAINPAPIESCNVNENNQFECEITGHTTNGKTGELFKVQNYDYCSSKI